MKSTTKKLQRLSATATLVIGTLLAASSSAQAASFTSNVSQNTDPTKDILLNSITQKNAKGQDVTFKNFSYVNKVDMTSTITERNGTTTQLKNEARVAGKSNSGAASTDRGRNASSPMATNEDPTGAEAAAFLGNNNLNNIIDTEDTGNFVMNLFFDKEIRQDASGLDSLYFWERGMNSSMVVEAIDAAGRVISKAVTMNQTKQASNAAGFSISTTEIGNSVQKVGSWGLSLADFGVTSLAGIRVKTDKWSNGPDFKVIARGSEFNSTAVPEPSTILAFGVVGGLAFLQRRRKEASLLKQG
jgi:PEP-CTERM motif